MKKLRTFEKMKEKKEKDNLVMGVSTKMSYIRFSLAVLIGLYIGINISGLFQNDTTFVSHGPAHTGAGAGTSSDNNEANNRIRQQLEKSQAEIKHWKAEAEKLKNDNSSSLRKLDQLKVSCTQEDDETTRQKSDKINDTKYSSQLSLINKLSNTNLHPFCQSVLPHPAPTAMALWNEHILQILTATRVPNDSRFMFHDFTSQLLQIISPRLQRSVKTVPYDWRPVENALTIGFERYKYLQLSQEERRAMTNSNKKPPPRPLKILIMGGSLLVGTNCRMLMRELNFQFQLPKRECTWSNRVGQFLNAFFVNDNDNKNKKKKGGDDEEPLVQVTKVAMGGTNTGTGSVIWQYDLIPEEARSPDIVINAYSTNDMHILTALEAESANTTLRERTFEMMQEFVRQVLNTKNCNKKDTNNEPIPPLLLHMDDYLGNEQRKIWDTTELSQGAQVLANYYGFVSMSYADTIREFVYGDTYEKWFSSEWWVEEKRKKTFIFDRQIHPGMGMHISSMWVTVYNLLHLASTYCSMPTPPHRMNNISEYEAGFWGLPELKGEFKEPMGKPQPQPKGLPPELTKDLLLEDVTSLWRQSAAKDQQQQQSYSTSTCSDDENAPHQNHKVKCPFSW
ncbi:MAG: lysophospholipase L1-like esterase [Bacillariaceae sp.]|jgi:lysophospholipase L1-like esterase